MERRRVRQRAKADARSSLYSEGHTLTFERFRELIDERERRSVKAFLLFHDDDRIGGKRAACELRRGVLGTVLVEDTLEPAGAPMQLAQRLLEICARLRCYIDHHNAI